jgi:predicted MFS family arabinose efflux permease
LILANEFCHGRRYPLPSNSATLRPVTENNAPQQPRLIVQLIVLTLGRLFLNTSLRLTYPFLPEIARGLGVSLVAVSQLIALRSFIGFLSPVFGPLSDRYGRRPIMIAALVLLALGCFVVVVWPVYWGLGATLIVIGLAKVIFDPAMQAYIGDAVPYQKRGKAIAATELAWAGSLLLGAPAVGFIIQRQGWQAPFLWIGLGCLAVAVMVWKFIPREERRSDGRDKLRSFWFVIRHYPVVWAAILYIILAMIAHETILIVYGSWMELSFGLSLGALGLAAAVIGSAELTGEIFAGWAVDRFGKRPIIILTGLFTSGVFILIPFVTGSLTNALIALFALFLFFEIAFVGGMPLLTEIVPAARAMVMSIALAAASLGRAIGASVGPLLWREGGLQASSIAAGVCMLLAVLILAFWIREGESGK